MRRIIVALALICAISTTSTAKNLKWVNALDLGIQGRTLPCEKSPYHRFDAQHYGFTDKTIIDYAKMSSGLYVAFKTNSSQVSADSKAAKSTTTACCFTTKTTAVSPHGPISKKTITDTSNSATSITLSRPSVLPISTAANMMIF